LPHVGSLYILTYDARKLKHKKDNVNIFSSPVVRVTKPVEVTLSSSCNEDEPVRNRADQPRTSWGNYKPTALTSRESGSYNLLGLAYLTRKQSKISR